MRREGLSFAAIADRLNQAGHVTTTGKQFSAMTVHRLLAS
jgi:Recombinase